MAVYCKVSSGIRAISLDAWLLVAAGDLPATCWTLQSVQTCAIVRLKHTACILACLLPCLLAGSKPGQAWLLPRC
jgi:hypothetical protein